MVYPGLARFDLLSQIRHDLVTLSGQVPGDLRAAIDRCIPYLRKYKPGLEDDIPVRFKPAFRNPESCADSGWADVLLFSVSKAIRAYYAVTRGHPGASQAPIDFLHRLATEGVKNFRVVGNFIDGFKLERR